MRRAAAGIGVLWIVASAALSPAVADGGDPAAVVRAVMRLELWSISAPGEREDQLFGEAALAAHFTGDFAAAYTALMDRQDRLGEPLLDGDPITNSQEYCPLRGLTVEPGPATGESAIVTVRFQSMWCYPEAGEAVAGAETAVVFSLVMKDGRWLIDDFDSGGSFRALMARLMEGN